MLILVALLTGILVFEYYFLIPRSEQVRESIDVKYMVLQDYDNLLRDEGATVEEISSALREMEAIENRLIKEDTEMLASAQLQNQISDFAGEAGLKVMTIRPLAFIAMDNFGNVPLYFEGNGDIKQIGDFLKLLESSKLMIKIEKLNLNITNIQDPKRLKFKIQVSGLVKL
jgi:Tfp pilus assembly protein PilO